MSVGLQNFIHKFEQGTGTRLVRVVSAAIVMLALAIVYDLTAFTNISTPEGMDAAQLARNIASGRGYTTDFVRPLSIHLVEQRRGGDDPKMAGRHPDLANPPVYPVLLAGVLKVMPFATPELSSQKPFSVYLPDLWIAMFNQLLFFVAAVLLFRLARRLFDEPVAWASAAVFLGTDLFWRFSLTGHSTMLVVVVFITLVSVLERLETGAREGKSARWLFVMAAAVGGVAGVGCLTRYSFGWLIVPVAFWVNGLPSPKRMRLTVAAMAAFLVVIAPWVTRNFVVSGTPFGTASFAVFQNTTQFPASEIERSLTPDYREMRGEHFWQKLLANGREIFEKELPRMGGSWMAAFFLVGLLMPFRNPTLGRVRWFVMQCLLVWTLAQALGRTGLAADTPDVSPDNLLAVLAPVVFVFGASLFFILLNQFQPPMPVARYTVMGILGLATCAPMAFTFLPPHRSPVVYPPYYPPWIQEKARMTDEDAWVMTDIPWALAWYGRRQSVWQSIRYRANPDEKFKNDFYEINDHRQPVSALYLTAKTLKNLETQSVWNWSVGDDRGQEWESFVLGTFLKHEVPTGFPLKRAPLGLMPEIFLTDTERSQTKSIQSQQQ